MPINKPNAVPRMPDFWRYVLHVIINEPQPILVPIEIAQIPRGLKFGINPIRIFSFTFFVFFNACLF